MDRIASGCGGRRQQEQRAALITYTEQPVRQGRPDSPWEGLVAGAVLGDADEAVALLRRTRRSPCSQAEAMRQTAARWRPAWSAVLRAAEALLGKQWGELLERHGDWGRDGTMAVAVRHLGWPMVAVVRQVPGVSYAAVAQGIRRFWRRAGREPALAQFARRLRDEMSNVNV